MHLPQLDRLVEVADSKPAERPQGQVRWKLDAVGGVCRNDDLAAVTGVDHPRCLMHGEGHVVASMGNRDTGVHAHPHAHRCIDWPWFGTERELPFRARHDGVG